MEDSFKNYPFCENFYVHFTHTIETEADDVEVMFNEGMDLLRDCTNSKGIEFEGYLVAKMDDGKFKVHEFDEEFLEDNSRRNLFNYLSAKQDAEVFEKLSYIWHICRGHHLTPDMLDQEIEKLHEQGIFI